MTKKLVAFVMAFVLLCAAIPVAMADETKTLKMLWFSDGQEGVVMQGLINEYEAENPGIHIEIMEVAYADYENKLIHIRSKVRMVIRPEYRQRGMGGSTTTNQTKTEDQTK